MIDIEYDCDYRDNIICPYCGHEHSDNFEMVDLDEECDTASCHECGKEFNVTIIKSIDYSTSCMDGEHDMVDDTDHIADCQRCKRCGYYKFKRFDKQKDE